MNSLVTKAAAWLRRRPALARMALRCVPDMRKTIQLDQLGPFVIRLRRNRSWWLRNPMENERKVFGYLKRFVRPGDVAYDVGANIGLYSRYLVDVCDAGRVAAFEPMSENLDLLRRNIEIDARAKDRVLLVNAALGDSDGSESLQIDDVMSASAVLDSVTGGRPSQGRAQVGLAAKTETVRVARLDTLMSDTAQALPPPRLIKVDIEGAELMMLRGATQTLRKHRPILIIELHERPEVSAGVIELLESLGYHIFSEVIGEDGRSATHRRVTPDDARRATNYVIHYLIASCELSDVAEPISTG
jgi:FkbM family methyltransferase